MISAVYVDFSRYRGLQIEASGATREIALTGAPHPRKGIRAPNKHAREFSVAGDYSLAPTSSMYKSNTCTSDMHDIIYNTLGKTRLSYDPLIINGPG